MTQIQRTLEKDLKRDLEKKLSFWRAPANAGKQRWLKK